MPPVDPASAPGAGVASASGPAGKFRKLPGRSPSFRLRGYGQVQLYLTDAFLLQIDVIALREVYTKFAYQDVQAVEILRTSRGAVYNWILGLIALLFGAPAFLVGNAGGGKAESMYVLAVFPVFFVVLLLINIGRGATCKTTVHTVTGRHPLRSLVRVRKARKALALIAERIEAVQGALDQPTAEQEMENYLSRRANEHQQRSQPSPSPTPA